MGGEVKLRPSLRHSLPLPQPIPKSARDALSPISGDVLSPGMGDLGLPVMMGGGVAQDTTAGGPVVVGTLSPASLDSDDHASSPGSSSPSTPDDGPKSLKEKTRRLGGPDSGEGELIGMDCITPTRCNTDSKHDESCSSGDDDETDQSSSDSEDEALDSKRVDSTAVDALSPVFRPENSAVATIGHLPSVFSPQSDLFKSLRVNIEAESIPLRPVTLPPSKASVTPSAITATNMGGAVKTPVRASHRTPKPSLKLEEQLGHTPRSFARPTPSSSAVLGPCMPGSVTPRAGGSRTPQPSPLTPGASPSMRNRRIGSFQAVEGFLVPSTPVFKAEAWQKKTTIFTPSFQSIDNSDVAILLEHEKDTADEKDDLSDEAVYVRHYYVWQAEKRSAEKVLADLRAKKRRRDRTDRARPVTPTHGVVGSSTAAGGVAASPIAEGILRPVAESFASPLNVTPSPSSEALPIPPPLIPEGLFRPPVFNYSHYYGEAKATAAAKRKAPRSKDAEPGIATAPTGAPSSLSGTTPSVVPQFASATPPVPAFTQAAASGADLSSALPRLMSLVADSALVASLPVLSTTSSLSFDAAVANALQIATSQAVGSVQPNVVTPPKMDILPLPDMDRAGGRGWKRPARYIRYLEDECRAESLATTSAYSAASIAVVPDAEHGLAHDLHVAILPPSECGSNKRRRSAQDDSDLCKRGRPRRQRSPRDPNGPPPRRGRPPGSKTRHRSGSRSHSAGSPFNLILTRKRSRSGAAKGKSKQVLIAEGIRRRLATVKLHYLQLKLAMIQRDQGCGDEAMSDTRDDAMGSGVAAPLMLSGSCSSDQSSVSSASPAPASLMQD